MARITARSPATSVEYLKMAPELSFWRSIYRALIASRLAHGEREVIRHFRARDMELPEHLRETGLRRTS